jgi:hypothetical protein
MIRKTLVINAELIAEMLKAFNGGDVLRRSVVTKNPLPKDAKVIGVRKAQYVPDSVEVIMEAASWPNDDGSDYWTPEVMVTHSVE